MAYFQKTRLQAVREKGNYYNLDNHVSSPSVVFEWSKLFFSEMHEGLEENFGVFFLNTKNGYLNHEIISKGSLNASLVHPREVMKRALIYNANSIILIHNHPSNNLTPSNEDIQITKRLSDCCALFGISLIDHMIVGFDGCSYTSFKEKNLL